jgi:hypothetical protein
MVLNSDIICVIKYEMTETFPDILDFMHEVVLQIKYQHRDQRLNLSFNTLNHIVRIGYLSDTGRSRIFSWSIFIPV